MLLEILRHESNCCKIVLMQVEQFEILLQMQDKCQKLGIANFEYFGVCCSIMMVSVVFFL